MAWPRAFQEQARPWERDDSHLPGGRLPGNFLAALAVRAADGGPSDIQQILSRMPPASLTDLQKGDAVMIVSTAGDISGTVNAITLAGRSRAYSHGCAQREPGHDAFALEPWVGQR